MVRYKLWLFLALLMFPLFSQAQQFLLMSKGSHRQRIHLGETVKIRYNDTSAVLKGPLEWIGDSALVVKDIRIPIRRIEMLGHYDDRYISRLTRSLGDKVTLFGPAYLVLGTINAAIFHVSPLVTSDRLETAAIITASGLVIKGVVYLATYKRYKPGKWQFIPMTFQLR